MHEFEVHEINPRKRKGEKKMAKRAAKSRGKSVRRPKTTNPRRRPSRRASTSRAPARRRRARRRNQSRSLGSGLIMGHVRDFFPRLLGKLWVSFCVQRWGQQGSLFGGPQPSPQMGQSWTMGSYVTAVLATWLGGKVFGKFLGGRTEFERGAWDLILTKLIWTEGFARNPWLQQTFGQGEVYADPNQQLWYGQGGRWGAMQGIVSASPLDGIVEASDLDGYSDYSYGHMLPEGTPAAEATRAAYANTGYTNPYQAAYASR